MDIELLELQREYLNDLPDKLDLIYELLLNIEKEENEAESLNNLKGVIHSIKGSSGSYEINFISELCHSFEDNIELLDKGNDKKNILINCFHYYELIREFLDSYSPGKELDLTPLYEKLKGLGSLKKEEVTVSSFSEILICTDDDFFRDAILLSLSKENVNFAFTKNIKTYKTGPEIDVMFLISPKKEEFEKLPQDISIISLIQESEINSLPKNAPFVLITHHLVKDIRNEYFKVLKNIKTKELDKPKKILFVDDDESIHPLVKMAFKAHKDIEMVFCHSAREAQDALVNFQPDFIILDSMMPEISGKDLKKNLSENEKFKDIPVVFLTGLDSQKEIDALKKLGAIDVILKPFKIKELAEQVLKVWSKV
jgi:CheY-like chemotaxis protein/HPt (histidine-containing phosphotransfer) domain-containing protein